MLPRLPAPPPGDPAAAPPGEDTEPAGETGGRVALRVTLALKMCIPGLHPRLTKCRGRGGFPADPVCVP